MAVAYMVEGMEALKPNSAGICEGAVCAKGEIRQNQTGLREKERVSV